MPMRVVATFSHAEIETFGREITAPGELSVAYAAHVREEIAAADQANAVFGHRPMKTVHVIGQGANIDQLRSGDAVLVEYQLVPEALAWIAKTLQARSPILSGEYRENHLLFADGMQVQPETAPLASEYVFVNPEPYARKIEIGTTESGRAFEVNVPNRIYQRTATDAAARFAGAARITFELRLDAGGAERGRGRASAYPAIVVRPS